MDANSFRIPVTLRGRYIELVPMQREHREALLAAARDPAVFRYLRVGPVRSLADMDHVIDTIAAEQVAGTALPFTTVLLPERRPIGMTRFLRIERENRSVEIGGTWIAPEYWRTPVNSESKFLLLRHAFDVERAHRVQLQTDARNERSQAAIARLGAVREGVHREDALLPDDYLRSSVFFSILEGEWPKVRARLEAALARPWTRPASP
jgi:RimJ/RimL family protein N-acetyltransferase